MSRNKVNKSINIPSRFMHKFERGDIVIVTDPFDTDLTVTGDALRLLSEAGGEWIATDKLERQFMAGCPYVNFELSVGPCTKPARGKLIEIIIREINGVRYTKDHADGCHMEEIQELVDVHKKDIRNLRTIQRHYKIADRRGL